MCIHQIELILQKLSDLYKHIYFVQSSVPLLATRWRYIHI